ncbi:MAG: hypothetical protein HYY30_07530 [Chloroflexi bacterium]|nr:hypothetical protein [Chloroflexota bacterium]
MSKKCVKINLTGEELGWLRQEVFCNQALSGEQRRRMVKKITPLPADGSRVDVYIDGEFVGAV